MTSIALNYGTCGLENSWEMKEILAAVETLLRTEYKVVNYFIIELMQNIFLLRKMQQKLNYFHFDISN